MQSNIVVLGKKSIRAIYGYINSFFFFFKFFFIIFLLFLFLFFLQDFRTNSSHLLLFLRCCPQVTSSTCIFFLSSFFFFIFIFLFLLLLLFYFHLSQLSPLKEDSEHVVSETSNMYDPARSDGWTFFSLLYMMKVYDESKGKLVFDRRIGILPWFSGSLWFQALGGHFFLICCFIFIFLLYFWSVISWR